MHPTKKAARIAGAVYLSMVFTAPFTLLYIPNKLIVRGDATATANNILAHERLFRWGFASDIIAGLCVMPLIMLLYELLKIINRRVALTAVFFSLVGSAVQSTALA